MHGCEDGFHLRQMGLDRFAEGESIRGLQKYLSHEHVTSGVAVDPFHRLIGVRGASHALPSAGLEG
jgi:hypothetical protein